ncbi:MAG: DEAD/DEAH box helicase [Ignavibacteria bacterium]|nr:DEAD/DEAH box helicase [Ignavibacteria bacterium]
MKETITFLDVLENFRKYSFNQQHKGDKFERLMQAYLQTDPKYSNLFSNVWMWNDFFARNDFGGNDIGIDLVAKTQEGDYWAIQCKCYQEDTTIDKPAVDSFLSTSSKSFTDSSGKTVHFKHRLWISTTSKWGSNAEEAIRNQDIPVNRINITDLIEAPVDWKKLEKGLLGEVSRLKKKSLFTHQTKAVNDAHEYFKTEERGKLIMACGTGKTFTSLKIAENETAGKGLILFLVPSIALLSQALREWYAEADEPINAICICSDPEVSRKKSKNEDSDGFSTMDLALPASTNIKDIEHQFLYSRKHKGLTVVFSTYQSIKVISDVQKQLLKNKKTNAIFDLVICDEAHRTTGVTLADEDESAFVKVHDNKYIQAKKRLYMTATPRLYNDDSKTKAAQIEAVLCSMDDEKIYGKEIYRIGFGEAVEKDLLSDYKVLILSISEADMPAAVQQMVKDPNNEINSDDASKLIGCINALSKQILGDAGIIKSSDPEPMRRAVAFCQSIKISKKISTAFNDTRKVYFDTLTKERREKLVSVDSQHIDGTMTAPMRDEKLVWLKAVSDDPMDCRVLTNVRCLSEGVDVPSLDAVLFLSARNSQIDVVQSVGRVMRKAPGKKYGYIIIPIVVPVDVPADKALDDNEKYKVVWSVLNALRAHDDRFNATINKLELNKNKPSQILVGTPDMGDNETSSGTRPANNIQLPLQFEQLQSVIYARMVLKVGDRRYWEQWANDVAKIAERHNERITNLVKKEDKYKEVFENFLEGLRKNINPSISQTEAIEMLAQHLITQPVFEALFDGYSFVKNNPISVSMQKMLDLLQEQSLEKDTEILNKFYESVKTRASGIDNAEGKQRIIIELYDKFFKTAFPKMVERLGIVYTPVEVVDFIVNSVEDILQKEFGRSISDENIHILDPFTGTGTFITRLLQSGLIKPEDLERKYKHEIHANEIVLLAYYIAAVNIENAYHDQTPDPNDGIGKTKYTPFDGICLTDTFQLGETDDNKKLFSEMFPQNSERVQAQKKAPIRIIMGNPPYSAGQKTANDNAQNQKYDTLDKRVASTYATSSLATNKNSLYDPYIKAFRWSTDRLDSNGGIIAFVSNGKWTYGNSLDGFRKCLEREFSSIYIFDLRGDQRTSGELSRMEGGKVFGSGSRAKITITLLVKKPGLKQPSATIYYHDIGDYLNRDEKLKALVNFKSIDSKYLVWVKLTPNEHGDWLNQRNDVFKTFIPLVPEKRYSLESKSYFVLQGPGIVTNRDAWVYNFNSHQVLSNTKRMLEFYNIQRISFARERNSNQSLPLEDFIDNNPKSISWTRSLKNNARNNLPIKHHKHVSRIGLYRPFTKEFLYADASLLESLGINIKLFPSEDIQNLVINVSGVGSSKGFSVLMTNILTDYQTLFNTQCFPLYYYETDEKQSPTLFDSSQTNVNNNYIQRDGITNFALEQSKKLYGTKVDKVDIFYFIYGILHASDYSVKFTNDLTKMLPRIPLPDEPKDFWAFSKAGRELAELHLYYETVKPANVKVTGAESKFYTIQKMRFPNKTDKSTILFNSKIKIEGIPTEAYEYIVNGKSAIEWIMERYQVTTNKDSGIKNDPNDWAEEVGNPRYILDLLLSIITVSLETVRIVKSLPKLKF